jgi:hypothetical protein
MPLRTRTCREWKAGIREMKVSFVMSASTRGSLPEFLMHMGHCRLHRVVVSTMSFVG